MKPLILFPCNGNTREAVSVVEAINRVTPTWELLGFSDDNPALQGTTQMGYPVCGTRDVLQAHPEAYVLAAPGRPDNYWRRLAPIEELGVSAARWATLVHPDAQIGAGCTVGNNVLIQAGVVLTASVEVADHVAILPNTVLSHDVSVGRGTLIGAGVVIAGGVRLQQSAYVGSGSRLLQEIIIGEFSLVGLGATVIFSVPPHTVVAGNPARMLRCVLTKS